MYSWEELPWNLLNLVTGHLLLDNIGNKVQENSGRQIRSEIWGDNWKKKGREKAGEKTVDNVEESLGEIYKLNICQKEFKIRKSS